LFLFFCVFFEAFEALTRTWELRKIEATTTK